MYACIIKTHLLLAYSTKTDEWMQQLSSWLTAKGNGDLGDVSLSKLKQSVENATVLNGLWMFYAFYETLMLRTVRVMCYVFILHQWKNLLTYLAGLMYPWCWSVILTFLANKSVIIYFFINTKRITCHFEFVLMCAIWFFIWMENFSYTISLTCCSLIPIRSTIPFIVYYLRLLHFEFSA